MIMTKEDKISIQCKYRTNEKIPNHIYAEASEPGLQGDTGTSGSPD